jgi:hypothetical protein
LNATRAIATVTCAEADAAHSVSDVKTSTIRVSKRRALYVNALAEPIRTPGCTETLRLLFSGAPVPQTPQASHDLL